MIAADNEIIWLSETLKTVKFCLSNFVMSKILNHFLLTRSFAEHSIMQIFKSDVLVIAKSDIVFLWLITWDIIWNWLNCSIFVNVLRVDECSLDLNEN
jgi:hypothetical protein